jgi:hypothetical protein
MSITTNQEAVMSTSVPRQHPAVVLRSHYRQLRSLVAVLVVAVVGLTTTLVVVAGDDEPITKTSSVNTRSYPTINDPFQSRTEVPRSEAKPDESAIAAAISPKQSVSSPDESKIAAAISEHSDVGPVARARAYQQALNDMTPQQRAHAFSGQK